MPCMPAMRNDARYGREFDQCLRSDSTASAAISAAAADDGANAEEMLLKALTVEGLEKFHPALRDLGVCSVSMLAGLEPSHQDQLGITAFQLTYMQKLANAVNTNPSGQNALDSTDAQLRSMQNLSLKSKKKPFATTRVIIDGRGCLVGKGNNFSAPIFKERLDAMLLKVGAHADQIKFECVAHFEQHNKDHPKYNPYHPCTYVTEALNTIGIRFIDPGIKTGADDMAIKRILNEVVDECSEPNETCVVLIANDKDFADEVLRLKRKNIRTVLFYRAKHTSQAFLCLFDDKDGSWDNVLLESGLGSANCGDGSGSGNGSNAAAPPLNDTNHKIRKLLLAAPERFINGTDFKAKWRESYGTDLILHDGVKLKAFLEDAEAEGACKIEMRTMPCGPDALIVHAPGNGGAVVGGDGSGGGNSSNAAAPPLNDTNHKIRKLLLAAPGRFINGTDFKAKWRESYGTDLILYDGVKLKAFLEDAEAEGACIIEMRSMPSGPDALIVHAPPGGGQAQAALASAAEIVLKEKDRVQAKWASTSQTWKNATVVCIPPEGDPMIWFDGYKDASQIPLERIRKLPDEPSTPKPLSVNDRVQAKWKPTSDWFDATVVRAPKEGDPLLLFDDYHNPMRIPLAHIWKLPVESSTPEPPRAPMLPLEIKTTFEKALWLLQFEASRKKLASSKFDGVSVARMGSCLEVCVRDRDKDEQIQNAEKLMAALGRVEANVEVSEPISLPGADIDYLWNDPDLKDLEREERVLVILPKKGAVSTFTDAPAVVRLVSDGTSNGQGVARVRSYLSETYTSVEREFALPGDFAYLSLPWLEQQILQPAEERHKVDIWLIRGKGTKGGKGGKGGGEVYVSGVPWRVDRAIVAIKAAIQATQVKFLEKLKPDPELVDEVRKMRMDLISGDDDEGDGEGTASVNNGIGKLLVSVFTPPPQSPEEPPSFLKVTLAMAPSDGSGSEEYTALKAALKRFKALLDTFGKTRFMILTEFPKRIDAGAASSALEEKLGGQGAVDFAANCGLVKVAWNKNTGEALLIGVQAAREIGFKTLFEIGGGAKIDTVWLSWPDERLFRCLFSFDAAHGAAALSRLHATIASVDVPSATTVDLGTNVNPATYAVVRGASTHVAVAVKAVRAAVEAFVREHVTSEPVNGLAPDEEAFLIAPPRALAAEIESTYSVVVDFSADNCLTLAAGTQVEVFGVVSKPELNGHRGTIVSVDASKDRFHVLLDALPGHPPNKPFSLRRSTLRILSGPGGSSGSSRKQRLLLEATRESGTKVRVLHGDLLDSKCGAIVNAANGKLAHSGGVAAAIAAAAGPVCVAECRKAVSDAGGTLSVGTAVPTDAGAVLNARGTTVVVHAVVPPWDLRDQGNAAVLLMQQAVRAALTAAETAGACEVAIPLCGSGIYGWPATRAAEVVMGELVAYAANPATKLTSLNLVDFEAPKAAAAAEALSNLCGAASAAADATSAVPLPKHQWYFYCKELSKRGDGFQPYDYDQNQQVEAAWAAFANGSGPSEVIITGDAGGVKSKSPNIPQGKTAAEYVICFEPRIEDSCQKNVVTEYKRQLKREVCTEPPPLFKVRVAEAARVRGSSGDSRFRITKDGRGGSQMNGGGGASVAAARPSVSVRGFTQDARNGAMALVTEVRASKREKELRVDDAETPSHKLLADMQEAVEGCHGATVELVTGGQRAVVRAFGDTALDSAYGKCAAVHARAREDARKPPPNWVHSVQPADGASFVLTSVGQDSGEWRRVADAVATTMPSAQLTRLERVQNKSLWEDYAQRRADVAKKSADGFSANEAWCFHGTRNFPVADICEAGLDFRYGNAGSMWGVALYIAANASYSHNYSSDGDNGERQFFYVRAALGRSKEMPPDKSIRAPPHGFDSVYGTTQGSRVHMLYNLGQAYPEYIVTYRRS